MKARDLTQAARQLVFRDRAFVSPEILRLEEGIHGERTRENVHTSPGISRFTKVKEKPIS